MSLLSVTVKKARYVGVQAQQYNSYVTLKLQNVKSTTVTVKGPNPCWEQDFLFETNDVNTGLLIEVWSRGMIWDKALGYHYIPLRSIQYSNEEGMGQWVSLEAELVMRDGEVVGTKNPTGDSLLVDCRFELPFGRYDPPSGWKTLLAPDAEMKSGPKSVGDEDNTDWLPLGRQNPPDQWSGRDAENTDGDALQRKLERLNSTIMGHDEQARRQHQYYGHSGYSEDSDYTSDLNYPIGQHPNSSASQFKSAAQLMCTPQRSLETSRENSYERDDAPGQGHLQGGPHLLPNVPGQQGRGTQGYGQQLGYRGYNEVDGEPLFYNSRPRDYKEYSSQDWYGDQYSGYVQNHGQSGGTTNKKKGGRRPSLERQSTLYDDQYYSEQQYYDGTDKQIYQTYNAHNYGDFYNQGYGYQNERYSQEEEDKQWDSGGYYYPDNYAISSADNYQNQINKKRSSKKLPNTTGYSNTSQDDAYYTPTRGMSYEDDTIDTTTQGTAASRRKILKQQRHSSDNFSTTNWQSGDKNTEWQSAEDYTYYGEDYTNAKTTNSDIVVPPHPPKKRTLPQIRPPSRSKTSAVSLPQTPVRQLPNHISAANKQRTSAPVSRTQSADYDQNDFYNNEAYNENYNYAYVSNDNLPNDKFNNYPTEIRTSDNIYQQTNYQNQDSYTNNYQNKENFPEITDAYQKTTENYQNVKNTIENYRNQQQTDDYYYQTNYTQNSTIGDYFEPEKQQTGVGITQKKYLGRRSNSPFLQQNTDSLESRDDDLKDESFETAVDSICSSLPVQKPSMEYPLEERQEYKEFKPQEPVKPPEPQPQPTGILGGLLGQVTKPAQTQQQQQTQAQQQQQQQQQPQSDQRPRDQPNLLSNPVLGAMNVTKGLFSQITNVVNNTVQNINKQQKPPTTQIQENQVQRIQVGSKRGSLKTQESIDSQPVYNKNRQNSFDSQNQDYMIPEEPEYLEGKDEDTYYEERRMYDPNEEYYDEDYYDENQYPGERDIEIRNEINQQKREIESPSKRLNNFRHQDTIEGDGKRNSLDNKRNLPRQQESLDSCAEEVIMHNASAINGHRSSPRSSPVSVLDRYDMSERTGVVEPMPRPGAIESNHIEQVRKRSLTHDNSLIEPYPQSSNQTKIFSPSPPIIQKQQSIDLEGMDEPPVAQSDPTMQDDKKVSFDEEPVQPTKVVQPERRKMTAKERWHRAYNLIVQQLNVSDFFYYYFFYIIVR